MVHGANKSGARRKVHVRTATKTAERYEEVKPKRPHCMCGRILPGTPNVSRADLKKLSKTEKRPSRPYGGLLCAVCAKNVLRAQARLSSE